MTISSTPTSVSSCSSRTTSCIWTQKSGPVDELSAQRIRCGAGQPQATTGPDFGLRDAVSDKGDRFCTSYDGTGWFAAGGITGTDVTGAVANGLHMGTVIDNYLSRQSLLSAVFQRDRSM